MSWGKSCYFHALRLLKSHKEVLQCYCKTLYMHNKRMFISQSLCIKNVLQHHWSTSLCDFTDLATHTKNP